MMAARNLLLAALVIGGCSSPFDRASTELVDCIEPTTRAEMINDLDPAERTSELLSLLDQVLHREAADKPVRAALHKLSEIADPTFMPARDALVLRMVRDFHSPSYRTLALEVLMRPDVDRGPLLDALTWCIATFPDPGVACHGFGEHARAMGDAGPLLFAEAAKRGDRILTYYAARFACDGHGATTARAAREAVRDTLAAARAAGFSDGHLAECSRSLALMLHDPSIAFEARAPCPPTGSPGAPPVDANRPER